jgi:hypothetical protein
MTHKFKTMLAAGILAAFAAFFAATAVTTASAKSTDPITYLTERLEFRLERLETTLTAMQTAMDAMIDAMVPLMQQGMEAMLRLSDDIGEMADRILQMAEEIGEMADRIVAVIKIMADSMVEMSQTFAKMLVVLQEGRCDTPAAAIAGVGGKATVILFPSEGQSLTDTTAFELAGGQDDFILYASSDAGMANPTNILVQNNMLAAAVARIKAYVKNNKIYVAAKAVDGGAVGDLSNTVMVYVP